MGSSSKTEVPGGSSSAYLLVIDGDTTRRFPLPGAGAVRIGRAECELALEHKSASRLHARIEIGEHMTIVDLDSRNGTLVNNVAISGRRRLGNGDVITIGDVVLVVHARSRRAATPGAIAESEWRQRLAVEIERAETYGRSVGVVAIDGDPAALATWRGDFAGSLRSIDAVTEADDGQILLLIPELPRVSVADEAARALESIPDDAGARAGHASFPHDGLDADTLLLAARSAARQAPAGAVWSLADGARRVELGEHLAIFADPAMIRQLELVERLARSELRSILITGETGSGKDIAARAVHQFSDRAGKPFIAVNCASFEKDGTAELQLFGSVRGAFTGAKDHPGVFELADGGTLFLDEIGELEPSVQAKFLRVVESRTVRRLGDTVDRKIDVRVVAATLRDLEQGVKDGRFREDLYYRLGLASVLLPRLAERRCEIPVLVREFLERAGHPDMVVTRAAMRCLQTYDWPGSVRELKISIEMAAATASEPWRITLADLPERIRKRVDPIPKVTPEPESEPDTPTFRPLSDEITELEILRITQALAAADGVKTRAAALISMPIRTFTNKLKLYFGSD